MLSIREKYWRYSLFVLIATLGLTIFIELMPFSSGLLGAVTIYIVLRHQLLYLCEERLWRHGLAAAVLMAESVLCFLIPVSLVVWMVVNKVQGVALDPDSLVDSVKHLTDLIWQKTGYDVFQKSNIQSLVVTLPKIGQWLVGEIIGFAINMVVLLFVLYFMLIGGRRMESFCLEIIPFDHRVGRNVMHEIHMIVRSNAIGVPLLALIQGFVAYLGYLICGVPSALFWGVLTCFATIIPIFGTALIWLPLVGYMALIGSWSSAVGLFLYGMLVVTHVDNLIRFVMQKRMADTHPLVTVFGVFVGLPLFGFMGVIFGPLLLSLFIFFVNIFKDKYLNDNSEETLFQS